MGVVFNFGGQPSNLVVEKSGILQNALRLVGVHLLSREKEQQTPNQRHGIDEHSGARARGH
jgi:hypothetical protein